MTYGPAPRSRDSIPELTLPPGPGSVNLLRGRTYACCTGGGPGCAWQAGAAGALVEAGFLADVAGIVGTSGGALNGAHLAVRGLSAASVEEMWMLWSSREAARMNPDHFISACLEGEWGRKQRQLLLRDILENHAGLAGKTFADARIRLIVGAMECARPENIPADRWPPEDVVVTGHGTSAHEVAFPLEDPSSERIVPAVMASAAHMLLFPTVTIDGVEYIDGGFYDNYGIHLALLDGAESLVVIDAGVSAPREEPRQSIASTLHHLHGGRADAALRASLREARAMDVPVALFKLGTAREGFRTTFCTIGVLAGIHDVRWHMRHSTRTVPGWPHHSTQGARGLVADAIVGAWWTRDLPPRLREMHMEWLEPDRGRWPALSGTPDADMRAWVDARCTARMRDRHVSMLALGHARRVFVSRLAHGESPREVLQWMARQAGRLVEDPRLRELVMRSLEERVVRQPADALAASSYPVRGERTGRDVA